MLDAIFAAVSGLEAHQQRLDALSNNLANVNTPGFKKTRVNFSDLMSRPLNAGEAAAAAQQAGPQVGLGTFVAGTEVMFTQGDIRQTERPLDFAIMGQGFLEVRLDDGSYAYTRSGSLKLTDTGELVTVNGQHLSGDIRIPSEASEIILGQDGTLSVRVPDAKDPVEIGQIELSGFMNPSGLKPLGEGLYAATADSGTPSSARPGEAGLGSLRQGFIETSNVDFVEELTELVIAQRAYQLNARALQAADEVLAEINNLRR